MKEKKSLLYIERGDILLAVIIISAAVIAAFLIPLLRPAGEQIEVEINGEKYGRYPLDTVLSLVIDEDGDGKDYNTIVIKNGTAHVEDADCRDGICIAHTPISDVGETIVCLPHRLVIRVVAKEDGQ